MTRDLPIVQYEERSGLLDLSWGHPRPSLLPTEAWLAATEATLSAYGWQALAYGYDAGPGPLRDWIADHLGRTDDRAGRASDIFVTAGASHALALVCAVLAQPGDLVLVDSPTYHLAFRTLLDQGVELAAVPVDDDGVDAVAVAELVSAARRQGRRVPLFYTVPTFGNPTGRSLPESRRLEVVELAQRTGLTIVEDDTYRELAYDGVAPASLWSRADGRCVVRIGSFAKTVAPGLRLGWIQAAPELVDRVSRLGYVHSGGGVNHTTALTMATFGASGAYEQHVGEVRREYACQRDALVSALRTSLPNVDVPTPAGGWFVWLALPAEIRASALRPIAEQRGVSFVEGRLFHADHVSGDDHVRLSFSLLGPDDLAEAARRLALAVQAIA